MICTYTFDFEYDSTAIATVAENIKSVGAAGFILRLDPAIGSTLVKGTAMSLQVPGIILNSMHDSMVCHYICRIQLSSSAILFSISYMDS